MIARLKPSVSSPWDENPMWNDGKLLNISFLCLACHINFASPSQKASGMSRGAPPWRMRQVYINSIQSHIFLKIKVIFTCLYEARINFQQHSITACSTWSTMRVCFNLIASVIYSILSHLYSIIQGSNEHSSTAVGPYFKIALEGILHFFIYIFRKKYICCS